MHLTEKLLGVYLHEIFPGNTIIHNKKLLGYYPDYYIPSEKLVVEFDGFYHYSSPSQIITDQTKDDVYTSVGIKVKRIPYFIQWCSDTVKHLFNLDIEHLQLYNHGFIDDKALLPSAFCELGVDKFKKDLLRFSFAYDDVIESLRTKIDKAKHPYIVIPPSMADMI